MHSSLDDGRIEFRPASPSTPGAARLAGHRGDESIRSEILGEIAQAPWLDLAGVSVTVDRGEVAFDGEVAERRLRIAVREIAARCRGVRAVNDRLRVARRTGAL
jgi:osmotically-inducible protein OsmY